MFDNKIASIYRIGSKFAKWASIFCKFLPEDTFTTRNRLLELSQSIPLNIAAAGGTNATHAERQQFFKRALSCALEYSSTLKTIRCNTTADSVLLKDGHRIIDILIAFLTEEVSVIVLTDEKASTVASVSGINK